MAASLPYAEMMNREEKLQRFFLKAEAWGWRKAFAALKKNSLLVADKEVITALQQIYRALPCKLHSRDEPLEIEAEASDIIYCLCLSGELQLVRKLRAAHPDCKVVSMTYDVMPLAELPGDGFPTQPIQRQHIKRRHISIALAGADIDYLALVFEQNGQMRINPTLGNALYWWCSVATDVRPVRLLASYARAYPKGILALEGNLLYLLLQHRGAPLARLSAWLTKSKSSLLYLNARDKCRLAALQALLDQEPVTSLWRRSESYAESISGNQIDKAVCDQIIQEALLVETFLETRMSSAADFKFVTLEEFVGSVEAVYPAIASFFDYKGRQKLTAPDWHRRYKIMSNFRETYSQLRQGIKQLLQFAG